MKITSYYSIPFYLSQKLFQLDPAESFREKFPFDITRVSVAGVQLAIAIAAGWLLNSLNVPVGWLLGPMIAGILLAIVWQKSQPLPKSLNVVGQAIVALTTATRFSPDTLILAKTYAGPLLACVAVTGALSLFNGYLLWRWAKIDRATGFLGCIPGAGPSLVAMSEQMGADAIAVAVLQYLRILLVAFIIPSLAGFWFADAPVSAAAIAQPEASAIAIAPSALNWVVMAACGGLGIGLGPRLRLPSPLFLGPFLAGLFGFWVLPYSFEMPSPAFTAGLLLLGLATGLKFDGKTARKLLKAVLIEVVLVLVLIASCLGAGYAFHLVTQVDTLTAILGSTPGGITAMIATVIELGGDSGLVMAMQMTRMLLILLVVPWVLPMMIRRRADHMEQ
ncbi:MAG: AbrB family transcriptional regulator [Limnospira sp.]